MNEKLAKYLTHHSLNQSFIYSEKQAIYLSFSFNNNSKQTKIFIMLKIFNQIIINSKNIFVLIKCLLDHNRKKLLNSCLSGE
jgi:hypothetical protein